MLIKSLAVIVCVGAGVAALSDFDSSALVQENLEAKTIFFCSSKFNKNTYSVPLSELDNLFYSPAIVEASELSNQEARNGAVVKDYSGVNVNLNFAGPIESGQFTIKGQAYICGTKKI